jgi:hypothetical protein
MQLGAARVEELSEASDLVRHGRRPGSSR